MHLQLSCWLTELLLQLIYFAAAVQLSSEMGLFPGGYSVCVEGLAAFALAFWSMLTLDSHSVHKGHIVV